MVFMSIWILWTFNVGIRAILTRKRKNADASMPASSAIAFLLNFFFPSHLKAEKTMESGVDASQQRKKWKQTTKCVPVFGFYVYWERCAKSERTAYAHI